MPHYFSESVDLENGAVFMVHVAHPLLADMAPPGAVIGAAVILVVGAVVVLSGLLGMVFYVVRRATRGTRAGPEAEQRADD